MSLRAFINSHSLWVVTDVHSRSTYKKYHHKAYPNEPFQNKTYQDTKNIPDKTYRDTTNIPDKTYRDI